MFQGYGQLRIPSSFIQPTSVVIKFDSSYLAGKLKSKDFPVTARKARRSSRGIALLILNLGTGWMCVVIFNPRPLYPRERNPALVE
jgi:hypothetical protein